ncbi:MAG: hypothetical protein ABFC67_14865 [Mizugakiibacter sp.]|uniref:hypothetical protein n=1 Tax=Mizugakiibacter sp. TaxID=1972610 RepID=UPI0031C58A92|nr:hypothetical protein [Xanthomonadaceae bacterium]
MKFDITLAGLGLAMVAALIAAIAVLRSRRASRREQALRRLLDDADRMEQDLKECRTRLDRAHASVTVMPSLPAPQRADAHAAVDAALRELLAHRLWIRDRAPAASQAELNRAVAALAQARAQLQKQLIVLGTAQHELDDAMREHLGQEPTA